MDRGVWRAIFQGVAKSRTRLSDQAQRTGRLHGVCEDQCCRGGKEAAEQGKRIWAGAGRAREQDAVGQWRGWHLGEDSAGRSELARSWQSRGGESVLGTADSVPGWGDEGKQVTG